MRKGNKGSGVMKNLLDSLHSKILKSKFAEEVTEAEIEALVKAKQVLNKNKQDSNDGWIPCSSGELPQNEGMYLTTVYDKATGRCLLKHRKFENGKFVEGGQSRAFPVIAWQPLPAPYRGE